MSQKVQDVHKVQKSTACYCTGDYMRRDLAYKQDRVSGECMVLDCKNNCIMCKVCNLDSIICLYHLDEKQKSHFSVSFKMDSLCDGCEKAISDIAPEII